MSVPEAPDPPARVGRVAHGHPLTRRQFLRHAGTAVGALAAARVLAACVSEEESRPIEDAAAGQLSVANLPLYIDRARDELGNVVHPSLERFREETGIDIDYREVIGESADFVRDLEPYLAVGESAGWDLIVLRNGRALTGLMSRGYLVELPSDRRPAFDAQAAAWARDPAYDPGNRSTMAWQSTITGIGYNPGLTGGPVRSLRDLFDPTFVGMVGMFADMDETANVALLAVGSTPETSVAEDWRAAAELLRRQRDEGIVGGYLGADYVDALAAGRVALSMARSTDIFRTNPSGAREGLQFAVPEEGAVLWTDCMCIPVGAEHPADAVTFMDFVYGPEVAALIAASVAAVTPVPASRAEVLAMAAEAEPGDRERLEVVAGSPLVYPGAEEALRFHTARVLAGDDEGEEWDRLFLSIPTP